VPHTCAHRACGTHTRSTQQSVHSGCTLPAAQPCKQPPPLLQGAHLAAPSLEGRQALGPRRWGRPSVRRGRSARWACWRRAWAVRRRQAPRRAPRSLCSPGCWPRRPRLSGGRARPRWPPCARCRCACGGGLAVRGVGVDGVCGDPGAAGTLGGHACARTPLAVTLLGAPDSLVSARPLRSSPAAALSGGGGSAGSFE